MPRDTTAIIDVPALGHNLQVVRRHLKAAPSAGNHHHAVWAVIKANAYGHGLQAALQGLQQADGLALLDLEEAVYCRERGWTKPILLLEGFFDPADIELLRQHRIGTVLHNVEQLDMLAAATGVHGAAIDAYVTMNSGMHRLGFQPDEYRQMFARAQALQQAGTLGTIGKMTHFASADYSVEITRAQLDRFNAIARDLPGPVSVCNSAAVLAQTLTPYIVGESQWARPGICLYGASPFLHIAAQAFDLRPAMALVARLINVHTLPAGDGIGYGLTFHAEQAMRVGIVSCGYADGYPRHATTGTPITVGGVRTRIIGRVSMDMLAVDLDPVPQARVGTPVILWGNGGPSVDEVALASGTIANELLAGVTPRVRRVLEEDRQKPATDDRPPA